MARVHSLPDVRHLILLVLFGGCIDPSDPPAPPAPPVWAPCPLYSDGTGAIAECAQPIVPAHWNDPDAGTIELFVKRYGGGTGAQVWLLNGGPGASGADFEPLVDALVREEPSLQFFLLDHRGTGRSSRLGCAGELDTSPGGFTILEEEWPACLDEVVTTWGDRLAGFSTTNAAQDLSWLVDQTREPARDVVVWGGSYGTRWANRYLQIEPEQVTAVSLHGITTPATSFSKYDERYDAVAREFLASCARDAFCAGKLGADPVAVADRVFANLPQHCPEANLDRFELRTFFAVLLMTYWEERTLIPAVIYRLDRCNDADVAALRYLDRVLNRPSAPSTYDRLHSRVLALNIGLSEFYDGLPTLAEAQAVIDRSIASLSTGVRFRERYDTWPRYEPDEYAGKFAETTIPMLMMQGTMDPATPVAFARDARDTFAAPGQHYVEIPNAPHSFESPTKRGYSCQLVMLYWWMLHPRSEPFSCVDEIVPQDFVGTPDLAAFFGTADVWETTAGAAPSTPRRLDEIRRALQRTDIAMP